MFTRNEVLTAVDATNVMSSPEFKEFVDAITGIYPHTMYSKEGSDLIRSALYLDTSFDAVTSGLLLIYNELVQTRGPTEVNLVYTTFFKSDIMHDAAAVCMDRTVTLRTCGDTTDVVFELIVLLNLYYHGGHYAKTK